MKINEAIRSLRIKNCLTLSELAEKVGTHTETICRWELGKVIPSAKSIRKLAKALGVKPTDLTKHL